MRTLFASVLSLRVISVAFVISANIRFWGDFGHSDLAGGRMESMPEANPPLTMDAKYAISHCGDPDP